MSLSRNAKIGIGIGIGALVIGGIGLIIWLNGKSNGTGNANNGGAGSGSGSTTPTPKCSPPYSAAQAAADLSNLRTKCWPNILIPVVGAGYYKKCMDNGKLNFPAICEP